MLGQEITLLKFTLALLIGVTISGCDREPSSAAVQPTAPQLVGTWKCSTYERGMQFDVIWYVRPDGTDTYTFTAGDRSQEMNGSWKYSAGTLSERVADGTLCKSTIEWLDANKFILTIIDNGIPSEAGVQRHYSRL